MLSPSAKKHLTRILIGLSVLIFVNACSLNESKIKSVVEREIGSGLIEERARLELEKQLGRKDSKLKSTLMEMVSSKIDIEYEEILIQGRRARVKVRAEIPKLEDIGALFSEARNIPRDQLVDMSAEELFKVVMKTSRRPAAAIDLNTEVYEFYVDFEKGKTWIADSEDLKKAYSKKNLVIR